MRKRTHGVDAVHDQVDQDLLQLHRVSAHAGQISGKIGPQGNAVPGHLIAKQNGDLLNNLINIHCNSLGRLFCKSARILEMTALARVPSFTISETASRNLSEFGEALASWRKQKLALVTIAARGCLTSWAVAAGSSPIVVMRVALEKPASASCKAHLTRF